jgi:hypothetical protein
LSQNLFFGKHLIKYPEQKPSLGKGKIPLNNSLVVIFTGSPGTFITVI